jgi:hypothetical protein
MLESNFSEKIHPLTQVYRVVFIAPGFLLALTPVYIALVTEESFSESFWVNLFFLALGGFSIYYGITTRLVTSHDGLRNYYFYPFYAKLSWADLDKINDFGVPMLLCRRKFLGSTIQLSCFIDDWQTSQLVSEIQKYAPQLNIPNELLTRKTIGIRHRPITLILYYLFAYIFCIPLAHLSNISWISPIRLTWLLAMYGSTGGIFGGMLSLTTYNQWLRLQANNKTIKIEKVTKWFYLLPLSGWLILFFIGLISQVLVFGWNYSIPSNKEGLFNIFSMLVGMFQARFIPFIQQNKKQL